MGETCALHWCVTVQTQVNIVSSTLQGPYLWDFPLFDTHFDNEEQLQTTTGDSTSNSLLILIK